MASLNEGDWGGDELPIWVRERIREVDVAIDRAVAELAAVRVAAAGLSGVLVGATLERQEAQV